jgi:hypothetical protein
MWCRSTARRDKIATGAARFGRRIAWFLSGPPRQQCSQERQQEADIPYQLDDEQRAQVRDCLTKEGLSLVSDRFARLIGAIEASIAHFLGAESEGKFRDAHDDLRELWALAHEDDPPIGQIRARLTRLPLAAREYIGRRAPSVMRRLGIDLDGPAGEPLERAFDRFLQWTKTAEAVRLPEPPPPLPKELAALAGTERVHPRRLQTVSEAH